tara:strand:+ start:515 stop:892 length:378 start_codon:yes stop_codon:yes gene_type:complete
MSEQTPRENPNGYMSRAVRELFSIVVAPVAGQSRDFNFICRGDDQFNDIKERLHGALVDNGILDEGEYDLIKHVTTPEKNGILSYITGELKLQIPQNRHTSADIEKRTRIAIDYVSGDNHAHHSL